MTPQRGNRRVRATFLLASVLVGAVGASSMAHAQAWLPDRAYTEGPGIRAGDLEIHPGIAVRGGYDSNVWRGDGESRTAVIDGQAVDVSQSERGSAILAVTPHIHLSTLSQQRIAEGEDRAGQSRPLPPIAFRGGLAATYLHYFREGAPKNVEIDTDLWLGILPQRPFNIDLSLAYVRSIRPFTQFAGNRDAYRFDMVQPRARLNFGSRSQVLTGYVGYSPRVTLYESSVFNYLNNVAHGVEAGAAWRFLPYTALVYDGGLDFQNYSEDSSRVTRSPVVFADNKRFRSRLGLNGALTRLLSLRVLAGYALMQFNDANDGVRLDDHEDVIGEAVLGWRFGAGYASLLELGYQRDIQSSALGGWARFDRGFATLRAPLARVFLLSLEAGASYVSYGRLWGYDRRDGTALVALGDNNKTERNDVRVDGAIRGEYRVTNWLSFMADFSVQAVVTDFDYASYIGTGSPVPDPARYLAVMAFGGVRAHY